ncbi:MAG: NeuD/PglB/VioB family sugar acetyltransferase [Cyclobacteriaceae bacterium]|nr:NeuD/PglB/VioB family sugar acetyltransferase [Cyclobacteriaceae bacterium]
MTPLVIYGAGGLGREIAPVVKAMGLPEIKGFCDDYIPKGTIIQGLHVLGGFEVLANAKDQLNVVVAIGNPNTKKSVVEKLSHLDFIKFPSIIHPSAIVMNKRSVKLGMGAVVGAGSILTTDINVGSFVLININTTVGHDCTIGDFSSIMPGCNISGQVQISESVLIGAGVSIRNGIKVGAQSVVGMGSVVVQDVDSGSVVVGVPARQKKSNN